MAPEGRAHLFFWQCPLIFLHNISENQIPCRYELSLFYDFLSPDTPVIAYGVFLQSDAA
mgnify:CR=1 FL=1